MEASSVFSSSGWLAEENIMKIKASAGRWSQKNRYDLRDHCESLELRASLPDEPKLLAKLLNVLSYNGGIIKIFPKDGSIPFEWEV